MMAVFLLKVVAVIYAVAAVIGIVQLLSPRLKDERIGIVALGVGALAHLCAMGARAAELGSFPMANTHDALSLFAFATAAIALGISASSRVPQVGPIGAVLVAVIVGLAMFVEPATTVPPGLRSPWLPVHIGLAFLGNAALVVAGMVATVYLAQERRLKQRRNRRRPSGSSMGRLPALELLDRMSLRLIEVGFPLMTLALLSGALYGREVWGVYWRWELRNVVSVVVWALFAILLHFRITIGWRGRKAALLTLVGVMATLISLVGLGMLGFGHHGQDVTS
jgi:cytochrome c-type biogenesis protein CcsB